MQISNSVEATLRGFWQRTHLHSLNDTYHPVRGVSYFYLAHNIKWELVWEGTKNIAPNYEVVLPLRQVLCFNQAEKVWVSWNGYLFVRFLTIYRNIKTLQGRVINQTNVKAFFIFYWKGQREDNPRVFCWSSWINSSIERQIGRRCCVEEDKLVK